MGMTLMDETPPTFTAPNSPQLDRAAASARKTFGYFWREMTWERNRIIPGVGAAAVKLSFATDGSDDVPGSEAMWIGEVNFDGAMVTGSLLNTPQWVTSHSEGDQISRPLDEISDWLYSRDGLAYGGFTVDVLRADMAEPARDAHDEAWGMQFGATGTVDIIPPSNAQTSTTAPNAAIDHPMAAHMAAALSERLASDNSIDVNEIRNDDGLTLLHQMSLAGSASTVDVLLANGADAQDVTPGGLNAAQLAQSLGWTHLVRLLQR